jgi:hypothetical protein
MGPPKITPSKKGNTLFSYFSKSPSVNKNNSSINSTDEVLSPGNSNLSMPLNDRGISD